jgi:hypothetical protein
MTPLLTVQSVVSKTYYVSLPKYWGLKMSKTLFDLDGPQLVVGGDHGKEPALRELVHHYYVYHGFEEADKLTEAYIKAFLEGE